MKIHLPNSAFLGNIDSFLRAFDPSNPKELKITANEKWISIHPVVLSMVAALGLKVGSSNVRCEKLKATSKHYLERMGLFSFLGIESGIQITKHDPAGRFIPITHITDSDELTKFITDIIPLLHLDFIHSQSIRYIVSELVRNVLEHSEAKGAVVSAQYYKKSNSIRIGIVDTGIGIRKTINKSYNTQDDLEAIQYALIPGITGTTTREGGSELNAGAGLFFIKSIANVNRDYFMIYSGKSMYKLLKSKPVKKRIVLNVDPFNDRHSKGNAFPFWEGTAVGIDLSLDTTEEFTSLLDLIREAYTKAVKERKKIKYRRAKFI